MTASAFLEKEAGIRSALETGLKGFKRLWKGKPNPNIRPATPKADQWSGVPPLARGLGYKTPNPNIMPTKPKYVPQNPGPMGKRA